MAAPSFPNSGDLTPNASAPIQHIDAALKEAHSAVMANILSQEDSMLVQSGILQFTPYNAYQYNKAVMGTIALTDITGKRNPTLQYKDYAIQNRVARPKRFTVSVVLDGKYDMKWLAANPQSAAVKAIKNAIATQIDIQGVAAITGNRLIKNYDGSVSSVSASADGTGTLDLTGGFDVSAANRIPNYFSLNKANLALINSGIAFMGSSEYYKDLLEDPKFTSFEYRNDKALATARILPLIGGMGTIIMPGGSDHEEGITDSTPILPETNGVRTNFAVLPGGLEAMIDVKLDMGDARAQGYLDGTIITADVMMSFLVVDPKKSLLFTTTIPQSSESES